MLAKALAPVAGAWVKRHVEKNGIRTRAEIEHIVAAVLLSIGEELVDLEDPATLTDLLNKVEDKRGPRMADCCTHGLRGSRIGMHPNTTATRPLVRGMKHAASNEQQRCKHVVSDDELRAVWSALPAGDIFGDLVKLLLLTGQRRAS